ncbi:MAG: hypothetical protein KHZ24_04695 [Coriobacteriia bacterium]|nr:hypothetical protein [Coriobacteriia bacterium]
MIQGIKKMLKHILPPPTASFMREVTRLDQSIGQTEEYLSNTLGRISKQVERMNARSIQDNLAIRNLLSRDDSSVGRLFDLFESMNREDLRQYASNKESMEWIAGSIDSLVDLCKEGNLQANNIPELITAVRSLQKENSELISQQKRNNELLQDLKDSIESTQLIISSDYRRLKDEINGLGRRAFIRQDELLDPSLYAHALRMWYQNKTGCTLDLYNPTTYNEKIQWLKVFDHDPRKTELADKLKVRDWVARKIGEEYLIPLCAVYDRAEEIAFDTLPESFVMKATHGSGWNLLVPSKSDITANLLLSKARSWLNTNFAFVNGYEMQYNDIPRKIIIEKYLSNKDGNLNDYKFWCFNGKVEYIQYIAERRTGMKMLFLDTDWRPMPFVYDHPLLEDVVERPDNLSEMLELAEKLSKGFCHVRVDLYRLDDGTIKFGEMTFSSASGVGRWLPSEADTLMGKYLCLPKEQRDAEYC